MESLNPKSADEWREEEEARRFLAGDDGQSRTTPQHEHDRSHK
jgi:hypothetical protein